MDRTVFIVLEAVLFLGLLLFLMFLRRTHGLARNGRALVLNHYDYAVDDDDDAPDAPAADITAAQAIASPPDQDVYPESAEKAFAEDRFETQDRRYLMCFRDPGGVEKYAVVSTVLRRGNALNLCCHLSGGERRVFALDAIVGIYDATNGEAVPIDRFILHRLGGPERGAPARPPLAIPAFS